MRLFAIDHADGCRGHYCIGRMSPNNVTEYWNERLNRWCSAGTVFSRNEMKAISFLLCNHSNAIFGCEGITYA